MSEARARIAVVTGAASGIGAAITERLYEEGYDGVALLDRNEALLSEFAKQLQAKGWSAHAYPVDVTSGAAVDLVFEHVVETLGSPWLLVNNAGYVPSGLLYETTEAEWRAGIDTNLTGQFLCARSAARAMIAAGRGVIVNMGSSSSKRPVAGTGAYAAAKHGVVGLTRALAVELARFGVRVNCVCPARVHTPLTAQHAQRTAEELGIDVSEVIARWESEIPLGRLAGAEEIAGLVAWLASDDASYITGETINISGGLIMH